MKRPLGLFGALVALGAALILALGPSYSKHDVAQAFDPSKLTKIQARLLSGSASLELGGASVTSASATAPSFSPSSSPACAGDIGSNIKVNQNCVNVSDADLQGRGQAQNETSIAINPRDSNNLVASQNDYRRGDGNCYSEWSTNNGKTWNDSTDPMGFTRGDPFGTARQYWDSGGDTSVAYDSRGNAYLSCQVFKRGPGTTTSPDLSSGLLIFRSTNKGASWNFPGRYVRVLPDVSGSGTVSFLDKQLMTVDNHAGSPFRDRVYVTWTEFSADGSAFIYSSYSADYGETFSDPQLVSKNTTLCANNYGLGTQAITGEASNCNENQFSDPFVGSDGSLYVVWANFNNKETLGGTDNRNQMLLSKSTDGGVTFSEPVKVGDYYELPDCFAYQGADAGRACVPEKGSTSNSIFRASNYPSGAVDPTNPKVVVVTYGSYINPHSKESNGCVPQGFGPFGTNLYTGVKTAGACNNDILVSVSTNAGKLFTGKATDPRELDVASPDPGATDQWWQWSTFTKSGKAVVSYYDRQYGTDETTGYSDMTLSANTSRTAWTPTRVTTSSNPPPTQFSGTFMGDYTGLAAMTSAFPFWTDTRNPEPFNCPGTPAPGVPPAICTATAPNGLTANDQDAYAANVAVP
jgi:hypothetical protein